MLGYLLCNDEFINEEKNEKERKEDREWLTVNNKKNVYSYKGLKELAVNYKEWRRQLTRAWLLNRMMMITIFCDITDFPKFKVLVPMQTSYAYKAWPSANLTTRNNKYCP